MQTKARKNCVQHALCHDCQRFHAICYFEPGHLNDAFLDFCAKHPGHNISLVPVWWGQLRNEPQLQRQLGLRDYQHNTDFKQAFQATQNFTLTLASLASSATAGRESTAVDNTANLYLDTICHVSVKLQTGTPANDKQVYLYAYASVDGTNYTDNATGIDAAITLRAPSCIPIVASIPCPDLGAVTYEGSPFNIASAFGGILPPKWGIVVRNFTGVALSITEADHFYKYRGMYITGL